MSTNNHSNNPSEKNATNNKISIESLEIKNFEVTQLTNSRYIKPYRLKFTQNGHPRVWDSIMSHGSVSCVIFNKEKNCIILVRQFRPVVLVNKIIEQKNDLNYDIKSIENIDWNTVDARDGITYELCAGICDKQGSIEDTVREEILEECGYSVNKENIHKIVDSRTGVGISGTLHSIFYTEVDESMKVGDGGGVEHEGEFIELYELPVSKIREFIFDNKNQKPPGLLFGLMWFLYERENYFKEKINKKTKKNLC